MSTALAKISDKIS